MEHAFSGNPGFSRVLKHPSQANARSTQTGVIMLSMSLSGVFERGLPATEQNEFEYKLDRLAEVAIRSGLGLASGQEVVVTATLDGIPLVRRITEHAYPGRSIAGHDATYG